MWGAALGQVADDMDRQVTARLGAFTIEEELRKLQLQVKRNTVEEQRRMDEMNHSRREQAVEAARVAAVEDVRHQIRKHKVRAGFTLNPTTLASGSGGGGGVDGNGNSEGEDSGGGENDSSGGLGSSSTISSSNRMQSAVAFERAVKDCVAKARMRLLAALNGLLPIDQVTLHEKWFLAKAEILQIQATAAHVETLSSHRQSQFDRALGAGTNEWEDITIAANGRPLRHSALVEHAQRITGEVCRAYGREMGASHSHEVVEEETERLRKALRGAMASFLVQNGSKVAEAQAAVVDGVVARARAALGDLQSGVGRVHVAGEDNDEEGGLVDTHSPDCVLLPLAPEVASSSVDAIADTARASLTSGLAALLTAGEAKAAVDRTMQELRGREFQSFMVANLARVKGEKEAAAADVASSFVGRFKAALGGRTLPVSDAVWAHASETSLAETKRDLERRLGGFVSPTELTSLALGLQEATSLTLRTLFTENQKKRRAAVTAGREGALQGVKARIAQLAAEAEEKETDFTESLIRACAAVPSTSEGEPSSASSASSVVSSEGGKKALLVKSYTPILADKKGRWGGSGGAGVVPPCLVSASTFSETVAESIGGACAILTSSLQEILTADQIDDHLQWVTASASQARAEAEAVRAAALDALRDLSYRQVLAVGRKMWNGAIANGVDVDVTDGINVGSNGLTFEADKAGKTGRGGIGGGAGGDAFQTEIIPQRVLTQHRARITSFVKDLLNTWLGTAFGAVIVQEEGARLEAVLVGECFQPFEQRNKTRMEHATKNVLRRMR